MGTHLPAEGAMQHEMQTIPAEDIDRCGLRAVADMVEHGPVHIVEDGRPRYVIID